MTVTKRIIIAPFFALLMISCQQKNQASDQNKNTVNDSLQHNKEVVLKLYQALNDTNWAVAASLIDSNYVHHYVKDTGFGELNWKDFENGYRMSAMSFPDWKLTPVKVVAENDHVFVLLSAKGTHLGDFAGIPASKVQAGAPIMLLHQLRHGLIVADWEMMNPDAFMKQLKK